MNIMTKFFLLAFCILCFNCQSTEIEDFSLIHLKGYLGKEQVAQAAKELDSLIFNKKNRLVIEINSTSGDLYQVLDLAKKIYEIKASYPISVLIYINQNALGPAAIIPFLADSLSISVFVSWGNIPLGSEGLWPTNVLRNQVRSLVSDRNPHLTILKLLADAMTDPTLHIVDENGWKISQSKEIDESTISTKGETLVVNHQQLEELGLVNSIMSPDVFEKKYLLSKEKISEPILIDHHSPSQLTKLDEKLFQHIKFNSVGPNLIGYITVNDQEEINQSTWLYVKQALNYYQTIKPAFIILELNTPGGEVFAAQKISDALKELDIQSGIPVVAFINNWAISAGAMLAYSCRFITTVKDGSMGAAEPILVGQSGESLTASEKINSALRTDFANRASFFGRNPFIAEAMVDKDLILVLRHGEIMKLDNENQILVKGPERDEIISQKGKLLTLTADQMLKFDVADLILFPQKLSAITAEEKEQGQWPANKSLLFQNSFFDKIPNAIINVYKTDWKTQFFIFLASPLIASLLFLGLMIGGYIELNTPGFGVAGTIAVACLFLIIISHFSLQLTGWLEIILFLAGITFILVEIFILPTLGILGVIGALFAFAGLFGMMLPSVRSINFEFDTLSLNEAGKYFFQRLAWLSGTFVLGIAIILLLGRFILPSFGIFNRFVLKGHEQEGFSAVDNPSLLPQPGSKGTSLTPLRPTGKVIIKDHIYEAISERHFIEEKEAIVVSKIEGGNLVVKKEDNIF